MLLVCCCSTKILAPSSDQHESIVNCMIVKFHNNTSVGSTLLVVLERIRLFFALLQASHLNPLKIMNSITLW